MSDWYDVSGGPALNSSLASSVIRNEFALIQAAMAKLPTLSGNGGKLVAINGGASALEAISGVSVAQGGSGLTTITDHAVMLGSGTGAVTPLLLTTGQFLVGVTGSDPVGKADYLARDALGLGTSDAVQFDDILAGGDLTVIGDITGNSGNLTFKTGVGGETFATFVKDGAVSLYYNNVLKQKTTVSGIVIYTDAAIATPPTVTPGNGLIGIYDSDGSDPVGGIGFFNDLTLYNINYVRGGNIALNVTGAAGGQQSGVVVTADSSTYLYHAGNAKLATSATGVSVTGTLAASTALTVNSVAVPQIQSGTTASIANADHLVITFAVAFSSTPDVVVAPVIAVSTTGICSVGAISSTGFTIYNNTGTGVPVCWIAVGPR